MGNDTGERQEQAATIRRLNDSFRKQDGTVSGRIIVTSGIQGLTKHDGEDEGDGDSFADLLSEVAAFDDFSEDNDPYGEHDFGSLVHRERKVFWKIDYYDPDLKHGSENPADPDATTRVMTIMLADEY